MDLISVGIATGLGLLGLFAGIALLVWVNARAEARKRQLEHEERMKALEHGQHLPDAEVARAETDKYRATAAGVIGTFVPLTMAGAAVYGTMLVFENALSAVQLPLLAV